MGVRDHIRRRGTDRVFGALLVLIAVWVATYWLWEPDQRPRLSLASTEDETEAAPRSPADPAGADGPVVPDRSGPSSSGAESGEVDPDGVSGGETGSSASLGEAGSSGVVAPGFRDYTVREGDTFERIAQRLWGDRALWTAVAQANPFVDPNRLRAGRVIRVPSDPGNVQGRAEGESSPEPPAPTVEYTVQRGDTLSEIAARFYGSTSYTDFLYLANRDRMDSKNDLRVGQTLVIPPKPSPDGGAEP